ncbi:hypothetical protein MAPG_06452 [Magnaporthiopsis poae ATCC 64411]|uniref:U three protein 23 n=1 Tax=Magnaporthiopsis poae (strain ATCC 64411 / 73-15) TaxID=644358 RepID=A0A0C4E225_MAGP6|nr:hypothetical protein MAPG_06452 [Magnaporthiopsis poae ATCC 64411]
MKAKRSKQYRKLMKQYCRVWNFREPYQVLVDAEIVKDANRFKMDLIPALERTLHGKIKPMITQCSMRHLYALQGIQPGMKALIDSVKENFERRRCGHHPDETDALSTLECLSSFVVDSGKGSRNRYVVASQDAEVRRHMRGVKGVPLIYISRSVMIMEPMASGSAEVVSKEERAKFRSEIKLLASAGAKRKRGDEDDGGSDGSGDYEEDDGDEGDDDDQNTAASEPRKAPSSRSPAVGVPDRKKRKKVYGPKGPNPLAAKKKKPKPTVTGDSGAKKAARGDRDGAATAPTAPSDQQGKKKRKRKSKKPAGSGDGGGEAAHAPVSVET